VSSLPHNGLNVKMRVTVHTINIIVDAALSLTFFSLALLLLRFLLI